MNDIISALWNDVRSLEARFAQTRDLNVLQRDLSAFTSKYNTCLGVGDALLRMADAYFDQGDEEIGYIFVKAVSCAHCQVVNKAMLYLRMAQHHVENGDLAEGKAFLIRLCTDTVDNYEESIQINNLTSVWEKYKHLVEGQIPKSIVFNSSADPLTPEKCNIRISELFTLPDDEVLSGLSAHLAELSANGEELNYLNKWERLVFYADELCTEVNSGGFGHYLYYYGHHFEKAKRSVETIGASQTQSLLDAVTNKFPCKRIPKSIGSIQNALDTMEERGICFDKEDDRFYDSAEKELLSRLLDYVMENKHHFR